MDPTCKPGREVMSVKIETGKAIPLIYISKPA